jgi:hypothetical protein
MVGMVLKVSNQPVNYEPYFWCVNIRVYRIHVQILTPRRYDLADGYPIPTHNPIMHYSLPL